MTFVYGHKFTGPISDIVHELREELIFEPYDQVDWSAARNFIAKEDLYTPHTRLLDLFFNVVNVYEKVAPSSLREYALDWIYEVLQKEDEFSKYITIGPVSKMINMLCVFIKEGAAPLSQIFRRSKPYFLFYEVVSVTR